ncbi:GIY-YIG nuclease family protein [Candidatus Saccharibacteria bacterium]|nr:MAG: GIY-YIG nuclease family protein [Candidatus Saccharibacteria bacterium]
MYYVYLLKSQRFNETYVGITSNLRQRFTNHNAGRSKHTSKYRPWDLIVYTAFTSKNKAIAYEQYLKTGSGIAFLRRHYL